jgi:hypothetical protein
MYNLAKFDNILDINNVEEKHTPSICLATYSNLSIKSEDLKK